jgi:hypothetical protein
MANNIKFLRVFIKVGQFKRQRVMHLSMLSPRGGGGGGGGSGIGGAFDFLSQFSIKWPTVGQ